MLGGVEGGGVSPLLKIAQTRDVMGSPSSPGKDWQEQAGEKSDDRDNGQEFDQGESDW